MREQGVKLIVLLAFVVVPIEASAIPAKLASSAASATPDSLAQAFFSTLEHGSVEDAMRIVLSAVAARKPDEFTNAVAQTQNALRIYGKIVDYELANETKTSPSLIKRVYVSRSEQVPLFWSFYFYKGPRGWSVVQFNFQDLLKYDKSATAN